jgi:GT2 family glycosyltransferase
VTAVQPGAPRVSVVFATRDRPQRLAGLLDSLRRQTLARESFEVIAVDDASGPENRQVLQNALDRGDLELRVIWRQTSGGPAVARNAGWRAARAPLVAFTDDDCAADESWLEEALRAAERHPGAILQGPVEPIAEELHRLTYFHHTFTNHDCGPWFETANIFYPRDVLERLGGFDESFTSPGGEDTDLAWRALADGVQARPVPAALVRHAVSALGVRGKLRRANRWSGTVRVFADHPALRRHLVAGVFWSPTHFALARALLALCLPRRLWPLRLWLAAPYVTHVTERRSGPLLAPYVVLHDVIEMQAIVRGAVRHRTLVV